MTPLMRRIVRCSTWRKHTIVTFAEYAQIEITMDETVLSDIATWINAKVN